VHFHSASSTCNIESRQKYEDILVTLQLFAILLPKIQGFVDKDLVNRAKGGTLDGYNSNRSNRSRPSGSGCSRSRHISQKENCIASCLPQF
jgi:uncharacterized protein